jgi:hypothetical protein
VHCSLLRSRLEFQEALRQIYAIFISTIIREKFMVDVMELLRKKEQELVKVKRQVEALRIAAPLLGENDPVEATVGAPIGREKSN